jgi:hypothetical protein
MVKPSARVEMLVRQGALATTFHLPFTLHDLLKDRLKKERVAECSEAE